MHKQPVKPLNIREFLKSIYLCLAPKGSKLYLLTHTTVRNILNIRYKYWLKHFDGISEKEYKRIEEKIAELGLKPTISIVMPVFNTNLVYLHKAIQSVRDQIYPHWELCIADDASTDPGVKETIQKHSSADSRIKTIYRNTNGHISAASNSALELATGEYIALLDHDDMLHPLALYAVVKEINAHPNCMVIYSDEDKLTPSGKRIDPYFKSDFDYDLFLSQNMASHLGVYQREAILNIGVFREGVEGSQDYDLLLRILPTIKLSQIRHIPKVLYHWRISAQSVADSIDVKPYALEAGRQALRDYLENQNINASVTTFENFGYKLKYDLPEPLPTVELVLSTQKPAEQILEICHALVDHANFASPSLTLNLLTEYDQKGKLQDLLEIEFPGVKRKITTNLSIKSSHLNQQVKESSADFIAFIDNACIQFSSQWLEFLVAFASQPGIGCVSPKLVYQNGYIFSCGIILDNSNHAQYLFNSASAAHLNYYFGWSNLHKGYSALPPYCLIVKRSHFLSQGGFSDTITGFYARFIDLCLKMKTAGLRNVLIPEAIVTLDRSRQLFGNQSDNTLISNEADKHYLLQNWRKWFDHDPAFNPNLTLRNGKPVVNKKPRIDTTQV